MLNEKLKVMEYKIVTSNHSSGLQAKVTELIVEGWKPKGSHKVVETNRQNRFSGNSHIGTTIQSEYSQTMLKN